MEGTNRMKNYAQAERNSASSISKLIADNYSYESTAEQQLNRQQTLIKKRKHDSPRKRKTPELSPPQSPVDQSSFEESFGFSTVSTIIWYVCICILFIIAFLVLVLSVLYFLNDSSTEEVIKLYGITGSGSLAIVTFVIVFLDCCYDGDRDDHEEEAIYRILQIKEIRDKELAMRRNRRLVERKELTPKPFINEHQRVQQAPNSPHPPPYQHHHHYYPPPQYIHHVHTHPATSYHHSFVCHICHDLHRSRRNRHNLIDIGVDTSDKFEPVSKSNITIHKSTRDAQTEPKLWDAEHGTQTDRTEGTQTSTMELSGLPKNVTEVIHETTILKAPRNLLPTLKKSMEQQNKDLVITQAVTDTNSMTDAVV